VAREADAEIGVLGHVVRIPGAKAIQHLAPEERPYVSNAPSLRGRKK
jgi:hypothetical protein